MWLLDIQMFPVAATSVGHLLGTYLLYLKGEIFVANTGMVCLFCKLSFRQTAFLPPLEMHLTMELHVGGGNCSLQCAGRSFAAAWGGMCHLPEQRAGLTAYTLLTS